jgi:hypothetical protein
MPLDLTDEETVALIQELHEIVENDRYPLSPRIRTRRGILAKQRPEPAREGLSFAQASIEGIDAALASAEGVCSAASDDR